MKHFVLIAALLTTVLAQESAKSRPNHQLRERVTWAPAEFPVLTPKKAWTKPKVMIASVRAGGLTIELEQTDIRETAKKYQAELGHEGDAADFYQWLCFVGGSGEQRWVLWLGSGEEDGDRVGDFSIKRIGSHADVDSRCRPLSPKASEGPTTSPSKVQIGMSQSDLRIALGEPTARRGNFLFYDHSHDLKRLNDPETYTLMNTVTIEVKDGVVVAMRVLKSTQS
jgi:hypothetical protein